MKMEQSVPKRRHIKFRRRGITQKKTYKKVGTDPTQPHPTHFDPKNGASKFFGLADIHVHDYTVSQPQLNIS
jgi:hypothetical protein